MTEIGAVVLATRKLFVANDSASVFAERVTGSAQFAVGGTTNLSALMLVAGFQLVTNSVTLKVVYL